MDETRETLSGQVGIVTGAARGIGRSIAQRLSQAGLHTVLTDIDAQAVSAGAEALQADGLSAEAIAMDATSPEQVKRVFNDVLARHGQIHVLVNNVGIYPYITFEDLDLGSWRQMMQVNVESAFLCSQAVVGSMREHGYGRIVNFSSAVFFNGVGGAAYVASKAANIGFTRALALEVGQHGITVNAVAPGLVDTEGLRGLGERSDMLFETTVPAQIVPRRGAPEDIAEAVAYIVSPASSFITGQLINVDGGAQFH